MMLTMEITTAQTGGVAVIALYGDLDFGAAEQVKRAINDVIERGQSRIVVDLAGVSYIDSSGLGAVVITMKRARAVGGDLRLCGLQEDVQASLAMTGLIKQIAVHADREAAVASWR
jgi:anti-sigma B factor antagonist